MSSISGAHSTTRTLLLAVPFWTPPSSLLGPRVLFFHLPICNHARMKLLGLAASCTGTYLLPSWYKTQTHLPGDQHQHPNDLQPVTCSPRGHTRPGTPGAPQAPTLAPSLAPQQVSRSPGIPRISSQLWQDPALPTSGPPASSPGRA